MRRLVCVSALPVSRRTAAVAELVFSLCQGAPRRSFAETRMTALQSPTWDAANRITNPTAEFPATGAAPAADPDDPCVVWREYWSPAHGVPYYHNLRTHDVTWHIPDGFKTRFPQFHANNSRLEVDASGRVRLRTSEDQGLQETTRGQGPAKPMSLKQKLALYGSGGLILYLIIHNVFLACVFVSIYFLGIDLVSIAKQYGFSISRSSSDAAQRRSLAGTFVTAVLLNKMTVPVQLVLTLALAPRFVPRLQPLGNRLVPLLKKLWPFGKHH